MTWRALLQLDRDFPLAPDFLDRPRRVHFLGAGGIGMSALALLLARRGHHVSGSDERDGPLLDALRQAGVRVHIGHHASHLVGAQALIYSSAIPSDNPEWLEAQRLGLPRFHRSQLLAHLSNAAGFSIAVSGTHGKSTCSAMIAAALTDCGFDPTAVLGAVYPPFGSNLRVGEADIFVVEADESDGSFTLLRPDVAVILNVEPEHLENYDESSEQLWSAFASFARGAATVILPAEDPEIEEHLGALALEGRERYTFGVETPSALASAADLRFEPGQARFGLHYGGPRGEFALRVPGRHNVSNALAAILAASCVPPVLDESASPEAQMSALFEGPSRLARALEAFVGTLRRFERKGEADGVLVIDDYGHHPTEVAATLRAARDFLARPLVAVFQPHRFSRTKALGSQFGSSFECADRVVITELYSAHEEPIEGVSGRLVFEAARRAWPAKEIVWAPDLNAALEATLALTRPGDAVLTLGAGDITTLGPKLLEALAARSGAEVKP